MIRDRYSEIRVHIMQCFFYITKTCPCNIPRFFSAVKIENFIRKILTSLIFLFKTLIVSRWFYEYPQPVCFGSKIRKIGIPLLTPFSLYKSVLKGGNNCMDLIA